MAQPITVAYLHKANQSALLLLDWRHKLRVQAYYASVFQFVPDALNRLQCSPQRLTQQLAHRHASQAMSQLGAVKIPRFAPPSQWQYDRQLAAKQPQFLRHLNQYYSISAINSISTHAPKGICVTPKALRACCPAAPKTAKSNSEQPLMTKCWSV